MTASPSRGMLYPTLPEYDVFEVPQPERTDADATDEIDEADTPGNDESPAPVMARANWTGTVPADD